MPESLDRREETLLGELRRGDEKAFVTLVDEMHGRLLSFARTFTLSPALAEDIVQETWLAVIRGLHRFEGRSSLSTWIFSILVRRARSLTAREVRRTKLQASSDTEEVAGQGGEWILGGGRYGLWEGTPIPWGLGDPSAFLESREVLDLLETALAELPPRQRQVVILRDVEDVKPAEVCNILEISETNQRVLLHRGRARIRLALDDFVRGEGKIPVPRARRSPPCTLAAFDARESATTRKSRSRS